MGLFDSVKKIWSQELAKKQKNITLKDLRNVNKILMEVCEK